MLDTSHELAGPAFALVCLVKLLIILLTRTSLDATWNGLMHLVEERGLVRAQRLQLQRAGEFKPTADRSLTEPCGV